MDYMNYNTKPQGISHNINMNLNSYSNYYEYKPEEYMDDTMKEVYYAYCSVEFNAARIWVDDDEEYIYLSLLQRYRKFVREVIDPEWNNIVSEILDEKTIKQLFNTKPMFFHRFPKFEDEKESDSDYSELEHEDGKDSRSYKNDSEEDDDEYDKIEYEDLK